MPDYSKLLDDEMQAFVAETVACYPADLDPHDVAAQRAAYDAMARHFHQPHPPGVSAEDRPVAGVPCRLYVLEGEAPDPADTPTVMYCHGGGFILGGLESHDDVCAEICARTGFPVVSVDYRLAPEHVHPAQHEDAMAVARALLAKGPILLAGDSAGGALVAVVAAELGRDAGILGQVLIYPGLRRGREGGSFLEHAEAPLLSTKEMGAYAAWRFGGEIPAHDPTAFAMDAASFAHLPPTLALGAQCDPLADDVTAYAEALIAAGIPARAIVETGLVHGHLRARHRSTCAAESFSRVIEGLKDLAAGKAP